MEAPRCNELSFSLPPTSFNLRSPSNVFFFPSRPDEVERRCSACTLDKQMQYRWSSDGCTLSIYLQYLVNMMDCVLLSNTDCNWADEIADHLCRTDFEAPYATQFAAACFLLFFLFF